MTLRDRLRALVDAVPAGGIVTLPRDWLAEALAAENGASGSARRDDLGDGRPGTPPPTSTDHLLTAREVAERLGCSVRYVYAHAKTWPFTVQLDGRAVRFDADGLARWTRRVAA